MIRGEYFILGSALIEGLYPIVISAGTKAMPPILFGVFSLLISCVLYAVILFRGGSFRQFFSKSVLPSLLGVTLFIVLIPYPLIYWGSRLSTGINTALILQAEILFTFLFYILFFGERPTIQKVIGALLVLSGTVSILFQGELDISKGNFLLFLATIFPPFGNYFAKKALDKLSPAHVLFFRSLLGGFALLGLSLWLEAPYAFESFMTSKIVLILLINGTLTLTVSKLLWYYGLRRIDVPKAISILFCYPAFSLVYAMIFLREIPTSIQIMGFLLIMAGLFLLTQRVLGRFRK